MEVIRLVRIDFDNLENHNNLVEHEVGIFAPNPLGGSAYAAVQKYFTEMEPVKLYTGYNHDVYPKWRMEVKRLRVWPYED